MPSTAMHMQSALKPLPLAHGETPSETAVPKTLRIAFLYPHLRLRSSDTGRCGLFCP